MENTIYDRQIAKQGLANRVVDTEQTERHFEAHELEQLYTYRPAEKTLVSDPSQGNDPVLSHICASFPHFLAKVSDP
jgi:hypothetical protein